MFHNSELMEHTAFSLKCCGIVDLSIFQETLLDQSFAVKYVLFPKSGWQFCVIFDSETLCTKHKRLKIASEEIPYAIVLPVLLFALRWTSKNGQPSDLTQVT